MELYQWFLIFFALYMIRKMRKWYKRRRWLEHECSNQIERKVYRYLRKRNLFPIPQFRVKSEKSWYKLDFKINDIDLEIDGPFHETEMGRMNDFKRDKYLSKYGWRIIRVPYKALQQDFESTMKQVVRHIKRRRAI